MDETWILIVGVLKATPRMVKYAQVIVEKAIANGWFVMTLSEGDINAQIGQFNRIMVIAEGDDPPKFLPVDWADRVFVIGLDEYTQDIVRYAQGCYDKLIQIATFDAKNNSHVETIQTDPAPAPQQLSLFEMQSKSNFY